MKGEIKIQQIEKVLVDLAGEGYVNIGMTCLKAAEILAKENACSKRKALIEIERNLENLSRFAFATVTKRSTKPTLFRWRISKNYISEGLSLRGRWRNVMRVKALSPPASDPF